MQRGKRLGDFGLADTRFALDQKRALEVVHHPERGRKVTVGDVADLREPRGDRFAGNSHARHADTPLSPKGVRKDARLSTGYRERGWG